MATGRHAGQACKNTRDAAIPLTSSACQSALHSSTHAHAGSRRSDGTGTEERVSSAAARVAGHTTVRGIFAPSPCFASSPCFARSDYSVRTPPAARTSLVSSAFCQASGLVVLSFSTRSMTNRMCLHTWPLAWSGQVQWGCRQTLTVYTAAAGNFTPGLRNRQAETHGFGLITKITPGLRNRQAGTCGVGGDSSHKHRRSTGRPAPAGDCTGL